MITSTNNKLYRRLLKKGKGNILKAIRIDKGGGKGLIAGAISLLVFTLPATIIGLLTDSGILASFLSILLSLPGLLMLVIGIVLKNKRASSWSSYYKEQTGFSETELPAVERELASPSTIVVTCKNMSVKNNYLAAFFTEHYILINNLCPYLRRVEDIIAAAFSDSTDSWHMVFLSTMDTDTHVVGLFTDSMWKESLAKEIMQELSRRNPNILCGQEIVCDGRLYILERDGAQILRLYQEGRTLTLKA
ncbi:MAG: hypothetical protein NC254_00210 [bacterium]|nr:hypothetical protein [bacterium]